MKKNVNVTDKVIRLILAALCLVLILTGTVTGTLAVVSGIVAVVLAATALINFCPIYYALGISTLRKGKA